MKNILVLFGGRSPEYHISLISASCILDSFPRDKYNPIPVGVNHEGDWYLFSGETSELVNRTWQNNPNNKHIMVSMDSKKPGIITEDGEYIKIDAAFPVFHGEGGEDGTIAGFLSLAGIPFTGCDVGASAACMDKYYTNSILDAAGIAQAKWTAFSVTDWKESQKYADEAIEKLGLPIFVKPSNTGSSVGVKCAKNKQMLIDAINNAFIYSERVVCEEAVDGLEVEVGVLGDPPEASVCGQIPHAGDLYGYASKYFDGTEVIVPARIDDSKSDEVRAMAIRAFNALGCKGMTRVDFFVRHEDGKVLVNELNTIPGYTPASMYPRLWKATGVPVNEQISRLLEEAMSRTRKKYDFPDPMEA